MKYYNNVFVTVHNEQHNCLYRLAVRASLVIYRSVEYVVNNYVTLSGIVLHALSGEEVLNLALIMFTVDVVLKKSDHALLRSKKTHIKKVKTWYRMTESFFLRKKICVYKYSEILKRKYW